MRSIFKYIICFIIGIVVTSIYFNSTNKTVINQDLTSELDSLVRLDSLNKVMIDSLYTLIDSSSAKIQYIKVEYEKKLDTITDQSVSADIEFFRDYLSNFNK